MRALLGRGILVGGFILSSREVNHATPLLPEDSSEKSADNLIGVHLYVICFFSLAAFKIFSLSLILVSLINMHLGVFLPGFIL